MVAENRGPAGNLTHSFCPRNSIGPVKVGVYTEPSGSSLGGADVLVARLAARLAGRHHVELVHHRARMDRSELEDRAGESLDGVRFRYVPRQPNPFLDEGASWRSLRRCRQWHRSLSEPYDLFVNSTHQMPPFCRAPRGVLLVLFPFFNPHDAWPWTPMESDRRGRVWRGVRRACYAWEWRQRFRTYQTTLAISEFASRWTRRWWDVDCDVAYPPVHAPFSVAGKRNLIVSVGRFTTLSVGKRQLEMMRAYRALEARLPYGTAYRCIGGLGDAIEDRRYVDEVRMVAGSDRGAQVLVNPPRSEVTEAYAHAKVFWHAMGYGSDEAVQPQASEHFGITTVEAMAAGCVPVVVNRGAQPEIVEHGVNGFVWDTLEELQAYTARLFGDEALRERMAAGARERARAFTGTQFLDRFEAIAASC
ncbi:MAG: glycosyltransferase family 4 protein [Acidimicrobiia bacterium]|nr:glycosyltransferase family 4 protein [Acidimicrobiia bacterium]